MTVVSETTQIVRKAALEILDSHASEEIILLVSDINMPGMTGLELLPVVKA